MPEESKHHIRIPLKRKASTSEPQTLSPKSTNKLVNLKKFIDLKTIIAFIAGIVLTLLVIFGIKLISSANQTPDDAIDYETLLDLGEYIPNIDSTWTIRSSDPAVSEIKFESGHGFDGRNMILHFYKTGANDFTFISPSGETHIYTINIDKDKKISVYRR